MEKDGDGSMGYFGRWEKMEMAPLDISEDGKR